MSNSVLFVAFGFALIFFFYSIYFLKQALYVALTVLEITL